MDLDKLADLARRAYCLPDVDLLTWDELKPEAREAWRAAADAVLMAVQSTLPELLPMPPQLEHQLTQCLRERIIMQLATHKRVDESDNVIINRAKVIESYITGSDDA